VEDGEGVCGEVGLFVLLRFCWGFGEKMVRHISKIQSLSVL